MIMDFNIKCKKSIDRLEDNIAANLGGLRFNDDFLDKIVKAWFMEEVIEKLDFIKIKTFCSAKEGY